MLTLRFICRYILALTVMMVIVLSMFIFLQSTYDYHPVTSQIARTININNQADVTKTKMDCRFHSCFDIFRCDPQFNGQLKVYVHPDTKFQHNDDRDVFGTYTYEFVQILRALRKSKFATSNQSEACLFIPPVDVLSEENLDAILVGKSLSSIPRWKNGTNHLIINFLPTFPLSSLEQVSINIGNAVIAGANFITSNYRQGFDISIPIFNSLFAVQDPKSHRIDLKKLRSWKIIVSQISIDTEHRKVLREMESSDSDVFMLRKCYNEPEQAPLIYQRLCKDGLPFNYPALLKDGKFCLILRGPYFASPLLLDAMMMGCIPVIAMDEYILPFEDEIDWTRASVRIREYQLDTLLQILNHFRDEEIEEMRFQVFYLWKRYFSSLGKIMDTVLDVFNDRIFVMQKRTYEQWNGDIGDTRNVLQPGPAAPIYIPLRPASNEEGFTAVILTYNRVEMCIKLMAQLDKVPSLQKIIVVWNNPYSDPTISDWPRLSKPWKLVRTKTNRLTNRFYPFQDIETECVMAIDDDILMLTSDEIEFAYQTWKEFPDRLVGFPARIHKMNPKELINGKQLRYKYESEWSNSVSMVLTGAAFYHQVYNHWFSYMLPLKTIDYINEKMNCEDIAMNFLISNLTGKAPVKVTPRKRFTCAQCRRNDSLWSESSHFIKRSECLSVFTQHFGRMPLKPVEFRADPVLYQQDVPQDLMMFPDVGIV